MRVYELPITTEYVSSWGLREMVREVFQNAIDQKNWEYSLDPFTVTNYDCKLSKQALLLGHSTKGDNQIGKFGEGLKLAMLVAARNSIPFSIHSGDEVWRPRIIRSKRYEADILGVDVSKRKYRDDLTVTIHCDIEPNWLPLTTDDQILPDSPGKIYVGGLWVCDVKDLRYGYNFRPSQLSLDRDRRLASTFNILWAIALSWRTQPLSEQVELIESDAPDAEYLDELTYSSSLADELALRFINTYGSNSVAVTTQGELSDVTKPVIVSEPMKKLLQRSKLYNPADLVKPQWEDILCNECLEKANEANLL